MFIMPKPLFLRSALAGLLLLVTLADAAAQETATRELTLEAIHASVEFNPQRFQGGRWAAEGPVIMYVEADPSAGATHLIRYNLETGDRERLIDGRTLQAPDVGRLIRIEDYEYSADGSRVLIYTDSERVWRLNTKGFYYVYDIESEQLTPISSREAGFQMFAKFSPDGRRVGFVRDRNLFMVDLEDGEETQFTFDGSEGRIINGTTDWVYEEEFGLRDGWAWSPDGRYIAYVQLDESNTREFVMTDLRDQYPEEIRFRYPKAGEANSEIHVGVVDVVDGTNRFFDTGTWNAGGDSLEYIPQFGWTPPIDGRSHVWMFRLNRDQNDLDMLYGDPSDMSVDVILEDQSDTWLDVETSFGDLSGGTVTFLEDGRHFVWLSERDGYRHLYLHQNDGTFVRRLTDGSWNVTSFHGIDTDRNALYFTATAASPMERHLYWTPFDPNRPSDGPMRGRPAVEGAVGGGAQAGPAAGNDAVSPQEPVQITDRSGWHSISMSRDLRYYIDRYSDARTPLVTSLHRADGTLIQMLEDNADLIARLEEYDLPYPEFMQVPGADGEMLNAYVIKPTNFDPAQEYPLLMYVYGGPGSQTVQNAWGGSRYLWHAYLAEQHGILVASVDNRGTGGRSRDFKGATYRQLGVLEAQDQIAAARHLSELPYVDEDRTAIWGWSYGGFMTLMSMLSGDGPAVFEVGISVAPVTDWRQYDTIYTERYMSTPHKNADGYRRGSPITYADRLRDDQNLLIIHGDLDDNVHFQNAVQMIEALQRANKQFDMMIYPGHDHGIAGGNTRLHLFTLATNYLVENL